MLQFTGIKALQEIRFQQKQVISCIPKLPFARVVRDITRQIVAASKTLRPRADKKDDLPLRFQPEALMALQVSKYRLEQNIMNDSV